MRRRDVQQTTAIGENPPARTFTTLFITTILRDRPDFRS
jgi:hypothetical protein